MITPVFKLDKQEKWRPQPVETAETLAKINGKPVDLDQLPPAGGRIDFPPTMKDPKDTPVVGYHRVVEAAHLHWHQFWLWYLYNPWNVVGFGVHEGDWEFVQIACVDAAGDRPVLLTASQHKTGEKREYWNCERIGEQPVIYVAVDSHANYFTAGNRLDDQADGKGTVLKDIEWRAFGDWATWKGRWGNSDSSPQSPGSQTERWTRPELYHARAR
ncbi:MAG: hypothetical protein JHC95_00320 [Solirubrobacteraceae bacterium]|nr:hypothetical protein [Solirubrobacteraceae bacterium]